MYPAPPVRITFQNTTHVGFKVENTFEFSASSIFTQYHTGSFGDEECLEEENVEHNSSVEIEFVAQCMHHVKISIITIWITDCRAAPFLDEGDNAEVPECCYPGDQCRTVEYQFKLPCVDPCPEDEEAAVLPITDAPVSAPISAGNQRRRQRRRNLDVRKEEGTMQEFKSLTQKPVPQNTDEHFCVNEDYPCGPNNDNVHVCHYSARDGYKTYCVPEEDSDVLRFYPKDYCGPCVGGYIFKDS
jgi:hypothetical protein